MAVVQATSTGDYGDSNGIYKEKQHIDQQSHPETDAQRGLTTQHQPQDWQAIYRMVVPDAAIRDLHQ